MLNSPKCSRSPPPGSWNCGVAGRVPLAQAATAYDKVADGGQRGRWLLLP
ncbi:hypothetical protein ABT297_42465 [Dactylosporangium sp. NPDC000555]